MSNASEIKTFWNLHRSGKSAALDVSDRGELLARYTISNDAKKTQGAGIAPAPFSNQWTRIIETRAGTLIAK